MVVVGDTVRVAGDVVMFDCVVPSFQRMVQGAAPVSATLMVAEPPGQVFAGPLSVAVGGATTVAVAEPEAVPLQKRSEMVLIEYVVVDEGATLRVA